MTEHTYVYHRVNGLGDLVLKADGMRVEGHHTVVLIKSYGGFAPEVKYVIALRAGEHVKRIDN